MGDVREEVDLHVGELLLPFEFGARQLQFHLLPLPVQIEPVGEARAPDYDERIDEKGVPRQQRRGPDDDLQPPRLLVPEPVRIPRLQFEDVMSCRQVGVVGHAQVLDVLPFVIDIAAAQPVGETDLLRREERHGFVADVDVALLVPEHDAFGVVERLRQGARFRRRQGHAVEPGSPGAPAVRAAARSSTECAAARTGPVPCCRRSRAPSAMRGCNAGRTAGSATGRTGSR